MSNPFEEKDGEYEVLVNGEGQHSLWPTWIDVPVGWSVVHSGSRDRCLEYINQNWTDMRPKSLIASAES